MFLQRRYALDQRVHGRCSVPLVISEMQTRTTEIPLLITRMAVIKNIIMRVDEKVEKLEPSSVASRKVKWCSTLENSFSVP